MEENDGILSPLGRREQVPGEEEDGSPHQASNLCLSQKVEREQKIRDMFGNKDVGGERSQVSLGSQSIISYRNRKEKDRRKIKSDVNSNSPPENRNVSVEGTLSNGKCRVKNKRRKGRKRTGKKVKAKNSQINLSNVVMSNSLDENDYEENEEDSIKEKILGFGCPFHTCSYVATVTDYDQDHQAALDNLFHHEADVHFTPVKSRCYQLIFRDGHDGVENGGEEVELY